MLSFFYQQIKEFWTWLQWCQFRCKLWLFLMNVPSFLQEREDYFNNWKQISNEPLSISLQFNTSCNDIFHTRLEKSGVFVWIISLFWSFCFPSLLTHPANPYHHDVLGRTSLKEGISPRNSWRLGAQCQDWAWCQVPGLRRGKVHPSSIRAKFPACLQLFL